MNRYVKDVVKDNRTFRLTFTKDTFGLWYCIGEEIYRKKEVYLILLGNTKYLNFIHAVKI